MTNSVQRAAATERAKKKEPYSLQLMKEIKEALRPENRKKHKYLNGETIAFVAGATLSFPIVSSGIVTFLGTSIPAGCALEGLGVATFLGTTIAYVATNKEPTAKDQTQQYRNIQKALNSEFLGHFTTILVDPDTMSERTQKLLVEFLKHPYRNYPAKKLNGNEYRFFFDPYNSQVWADINIRHLTLVVRQSVIQDPKAAVTAVAIKGHYAGKPLQKGEKY